MIRVNKADQPARTVPKATFTSTPILIECVHVGDLGAMLRVVEPRGCQHSAVLCAGDTLEIIYNVDAIHVELGV
jgi:hypothetical protein